MLDFGFEKIQMVAIPVNEKLPNQNAVQNKPSIAHLPTMDYVRMLDTLLYEIGKDTKEDNLDYIAYTIVVYGMI